MAEIRAMRFVDVRVSFVAVLARALSVAAEATDDRFDAVRLTAFTAFFTVLHVVRGRVASFRLHVDVSTFPDGVASSATKESIHPAARRSAIPSIHFSELQYRKCSVV